MKNQILMGSLSATNQRKKVLAVLASFSFLLTASNGALAMKGEAFKGRYQDIAGFQFISTPDVEKLLSQKEVNAGTYVLKPVTQQETVKTTSGSFTTFVPAIFYKDVTGKIVMKKFDTELTKEQIEAEIQTMKDAGKLVRPYGAPQPLGLSLEDFRLKYGQIKGYTELPTSKLLQGMQRLSNIPSCCFYAFAAVERPGTHLYLPYIFYDKFGEIDSVQLDPSFTKEQIEQEIERLEKNPILKFGEYFY